MAGATRLKSTIPAPAIRIKGCRGSTRRLARRASSETWPNCAQMIGSVHSWAARELTITSEITRGRGRGSSGAPVCKTSARAPTSLGCSTINASVAAMESWKLTLCMRSGLAAVIRNAENASEARGQSLRPANCATTAMLLIRTARTTGGEGPTSRAKTRSTARPLPSTAQRWIYRPAAANQACSKMLMLYPEMTMMCVSPAMRKSSARPSGRVSSRPRRIPSNRPASG